jgi:glycerol-3-phosphate dehydrogenase
MTAASHPGIPQNVAPAMARHAALRTLADERFDLLIVGGGIVGAGALLDARSRGLRAALVEMGDVASGTSGRSSRLIHGGLRYLEQLDFSLVHEALEERSRLLRLAPHLVRLEEFLFPVHGLPLLHQAFYGAGILLYDLLGSRRDGGFARHLSPAGVLDYAPDMRPAGLTAGIVYHDGVEDDARYTLAVLRTAIEAGGVAATRVRAETPLLEGGRIDGARVRDLVHDVPFDIRADRVIDATGVWAARPAERFAADETAPAMIPARGSHIVVRRSRIRARGGVTLRIPGRVVFLIPWPDHWIIGTTDHADPRDPEGLSAPNDDVDEILGVVNAQMDVDLSRDDIVGTYCGLRPLVGDPSGSTVKASREHRVTSDPSGLVRIGGGKYTTYRVMARDAVDAALGAGAAARPSGTAELPLVGAAARSDLDALAGRLASEPGLDATLARRLVDRHGTEAAEVIRMGRDLDLVRPLSGTGHLEAEVAWAARRELAWTVDDVLSRRMRLTMELPDRGAALAPRVAQILAAELGWTPDRRTAAVDGFLESARREYGVPRTAGT